MHWLWGDFIYVVSTAYARKNNKFSPLFQMGYRGGKMSSINGMSLLVFTLALTVAQSSTVLQNEKIDKGESLYFIPMKRIYSSYFKRSLFF